MSLFLATFLSLYGAMHLYLFLKAKAAFQPGAGYLTLLAAWLLLMTLSPLLVRVAERHGSDAGARILAGAGYTWMGFIFLFVVWSVVTDLWRLTVFVAAAKGGGEGLLAFSLSPRGSFAFPAAAALLCGGWGLYEARAIRTERIVVTTPKLPPGTGRLRIVQLSDVHIGLMLREGRLSGILDAVRAAKPDLLVVSGDLVDGEPGDELPLVKLFTGGVPPLGKFVVTGNHEFYAGILRSVSFMERSGFRVLRGEAARAGVVTVVGVDDPAGNYSGDRVMVRESDLLQRAERGSFVILLKHRPDVAAESRGLFDLQLSGHVHGGQIFPFGLVTRFFYRYPTGFTRFPDSSGLYVSRGTGTWGPPIRFLEPPEVTVIDLVPRSR